MDDPGYRQLPCGCWERFIQGNIVTSKVAGWFLVLPCAAHKPGAKI